MVAQLDDQPSRLLVDTAIAALSRMTHRGGVAADGLTGDGCGLLLRRPDAFLKLLASEAGIATAARFAAGLVFLPHDADAQACRAQLQAQVEAVGCKVAGWREVPTDDSVCGQLARDTLPRIEQVFVDAGVGQDDAGFALALFLARRRSEQQLREHADFYVTTLTPDAISYKGMVLPDKLSRFFRTCSAANWPPARSCSTSASRPTRCRAGRWPTRSACSPTTARSTPSKATAAGRRRAARCGRRRASTSPNSTR
jgi:glutamate synthase (NADPH/NADH) large chain